MPGIDWNQMPPKHCTQDQSLQLEFLDVLAETNKHQLFTKPTHIHGNTQDLICTTSPETISHDIVLPGLSDHAIINIFV